MPVDIYTRYDESCKLSMTLLLFSNFTCSGKGRTLYVHHILCWNFSCCKACWKEDICINCSSFVYSSDLLTVNWLIDLPLSQFFLQGL